MSDRSLGGLPITGWLAIVLAMVGVLVWKQVPLDPKRAAGSDVQGAQVRALQDVNARLWEDPYAAVARARRDLPKPDKSAAEERSLDAVCGQLSASAASGEMRLHVLAVMVSNAPYSDGEENRRRTRYAVQSALSVAHFVPENADHLGFFRWRGVTDVPFEVFRRKNTGRDRYFTLVLWLEDEVVSWTDVANPAAQSMDGEPLRQLTELRDQVRRHCLGPRPSGPERFGFSVLGPANSQTLRTMTRELQSEGRKPPETRRGFGDPIDLYSAFATAPAKEIMNSKEDPAATESCAEAPDEWYCRLGYLFWAHGMRFHRVTGTDDAATALLLDELEGRGVRIRDTDAPRKTLRHVAIVSEHDTYYGRRLPVVFLRGAGQEAACETDLSESEGAGGAATGCRVLRFSYLRGLDGEGPRTMAEPKDSPAATQKQNQGGTVEPAEGLSQFDYLRRLAGRIDAFSAALKREGRGEIGAIGILGSDVYDKIALLRALRPEFPRAVFFTTDLDARLLSAQHLEWTRNVVVASSFGFSLTPCLQKDVPPFRGTYQTAAYFGARAALFNAMPAGSPFRDDACPDAFLPAADSGSNAASDPRLWITPSMLDHWLIRPRLFEIGRTGPVALDDAPGRCTALSSCAQIHPQQRDVRRGVEHFLWGFAGIGIVFGTLLVLRGTRAIVLRPFAVGVAYLMKGTLAERTGAMLAVAAVVGPPLCLGWIGLRSIRDPGGEPFFWAEGVSVWPSELLRVTGLMLGVCFLVYLFSETARSAQRLAERFGLQRRADKRHSWQIAAGIIGRPDAQDPRGQAAALWTQYVSSSRLPWRLLRVLVHVALFYAVAAVLFHLTDAPNNPARGAAAMGVEKILRLALVFVFLFLLFSVNDAIRLCRNLVQALTEIRETMDWPEGAVKRYGTSLGLPEDMAAEARNAILDAWIDTRFVVQITADVGPLLYFPFALLGLMIAARWNVTDHWDLAPGLVVVLAVSFVAACINAIEMQRAASRARKAALQRLNAVLLRSGGGADKDYPSTQYVQSLIRSVETLREGAFVPFVEQPLVRAALIPFSSAGGLYLVDLFALAS